MVTVLLILVSIRKKDELFCFLSRSKVMFWWRHVMFRKRFLPLRKAKFAIDPVLRLNLNNLTTHMMIQHKNMVLCVCNLVLIKRIHFDTHIFCDLVSSYVLLRKYWFFVFGMSVYLNIVYSPYSESHRGII